QKRLVGSGRLSAIGLPSACGRSPATPAVSASDVGGVCGKCV
ncbi:MAG: hypothetical protein AVDCRST_MAG26-2658, partial [uncultured Chloroflexia bacterium]